MVDGQTVVVRESTAQSPAVAIAEIRETGKMVAARETPGGFVRAEGVSSSSSDTAAQVAHPPRSKLAAAFRLTQLETARKIESGRHHQVTTCAPDLAGIGSVVATSARRARAEAAEKQQVRRVDATASVSRIGGRAYPNALRELALTARLDLVQALDAHNFSSNKSDPATLRALQRAERLIIALAQLPGHPVPLEEQVGQTALNRCWYKFCGTVFVAGCGPSGLVL